MLNRRIFLKQTAISTCGFIRIFPVTPLSEFINKIAGEENHLIKSFCIDFNWGPGGTHGFAKPGLWANANPEDHVNWYSELGCNVIQTFGISCNGYAWYKNGFIPEQPGLQYDFLTDMVKIGRQKNLKVIGYFCVGANNKWEQDNPHLCYQMNGQQIPLTQKYLDYLCSSIEDAINKTDIDGIMLDWFYNPGGGRNPLPPFKWLNCEKDMYYELMQQPFPGKEKITPELEISFRRKAINRAWHQIKTRTKKAKPDCIIWLTAYEVNSKEYQDTNLLKEVDWLMNEAGDIKTTTLMRDLAGNDTKLITCLANWNKQDPTEIVPAAIKENVGLYGFTKPVIGSMMKPIDYYLSNSVQSLENDERNIAVLARTFNNLELNYIKKP